MTYLTGLVVGSAESMLAAKLDNLIFKILLQGPPCAAVCALCAVCCGLCAVCCVLRAMCCALCAAVCAVCGVCCVVCGVWCVVCEER